jgi:site-specific DNA-cytosine methylase
MAAISKRKHLMANAPTFYEFFAGAGMARAGLGSKWRCAFANESNLKKSVIYQKNWKRPDLAQGSQGQVLPFAKKAKPGRAG